MQLIKYDGVDITDVYRRGQWQHPITGIRYPRNWDASTIEGVAVEEIVLPEPEPQPPYVPSLTPRQIRLVLNQAGLRTAVESAVAQADQDTKDWWEFSLEYIRDHPRLVAMASALGVTSEQIAQMFTAGAEL